jgi:hypothetical protein
VPPRLISATGERNDLVGDVCTGIEGWYLTF